MFNKGDRVGAVLCANDKEFLLLGYGTYEGDHVPGEEVGGFGGEVLRREKVPNPKIKLDNGDIVYGCECWWGAEASVKGRVEEAKKRGLEVKIIPIAEARERA